VPRKLTQPLDKKEHKSDFYLDSHQTSAFFELGKDVLLLIDEYFIIEKSKNNKQCKNAPAGLKVDEDAINHVQNTFDQILENVNATNNFP